MAIIDVGSPARLAALPQIRLTVSMLTATAIVVADMVGVGVFTSLGFQVQRHHVGLLAAAAVGRRRRSSRCAARSRYAELAAMLPALQRRVQFPLAASIIRRWAFWPGWLSATVGFAAPVALAAMAFGQYGKSIAPGRAAACCSASAVDLARRRWCICAASRHGSAFQIAWTVLKLALIVAFIVAGFALGDAAADLVRADLPPTCRYVIGAPFAISLVFVMYSYSGWNAATYIVGEMHDPQRSLPRALFVGTLIVIVALCRAERRLPVHHADRRACRPARCRA